MAGDWIKIENVTPNKPEIDVLSELLGVSVNEVIGALVRLWIWADQQTVDGNAPSVTKCAIDRHSGVTGFADALLSERVKWLVSAENGGFQFPNFERHNGQTGKRRSLTAKRVAKSRKRSGNAKVTLGALPREEKRREEIKGSLREPLCPAGKQPDRAADVAAVVKHYRTYHARALPNVTSDAKEYRKISARLKEGYTVADLCEAIDGCHKTPHNLGQNDRGAKYLDLELIVRSASHVNRFIENNRDPPKPPDAAAAIQTHLEI